jgi:uncharacterized protein with FMN-binding domain
MPRPTSTAIASLGALLIAGAWVPAHAATSKTVTYKGPIEDTRYGPIEAIIKVKKKKITKVELAPLLRDEVLKAQSAKVDVISGATVTSEAFIESLGKAVKKAKKAHDLK